MFFSCVVSFRNKKKKKFWFFPLPPCIPYTQLQLSATLLKMFAVPEFLLNLFPLQLSPRQVFLFNLFLLQQAPHQVFLLNLFLLQLAPRQVFFLNLYILHEYKINQILETFVSVWKYFYCIANFILVVFSQFLKGAQA